MYTRANNFKTFVLVPFGVEHKRLYKTSWYLVKMTELLEQKLERDRYLFKSVDSFNIALKIPYTHIVFVGESDTPAPETVISTLTNTLVRITPRKRDAALWYSAAISYLKQHTEFYKTIKSDIGTEKSVLASIGVDAPDADDVHAFGWRVVKVLPKDDFECKRMYKVNGQTLCLFKDGHINHIEAIQVNDKNMEVAKAVVYWYAFTEQPADEKVCNAMAYLKRLPSLSIEDAQMLLDRMNYEPSTSAPIPLDVLDDYARNNR